jgi:hypothetical protein
MGVVMDQGPLVREQIEAGLEFIDRLDERVPVHVAFWLKEEAEGRWHLYIASDRVNDNTLRETYDEVARVARDMDNPNLSAFRVKLIAADNPLARAALEIQARFKAKVPARVRQTSFGGRGVEEVYIYPPLYGVEAGKWRGVRIWMWREPEADQIYCVEFWPRETNQMTAPGGQPKRVPRPAGVRVKDRQILEYRPPENATPHLSQSDYEKKALEAVEQLFLQGQ